MTAQKKAILAASRARNKLEEAAEHIQQLREYHLNQDIIELERDLEYEIKLADRIIFRLENEPRQD